MNSDVYPDQTTTFRMKLCFVLFLGLAIVSVSSFRLEHGSKYQYFKKIMEGTLLFSAYIPADITAEIADLLHPANENELHHIFKFVNGYKGPSAGLIGAMMQTLPRTRERFERVEQRFHNKLNALSPEGRTFFRGVGSILQNYEQKNVDRLFLQLDSAYEYLHVETKQDIHREFPEIRNIRDTAIYKMLKVLAEANLLSYSINN